MRCLAQSLCLDSVAERYMTRYFVSVIVLSSTCHAELVSVSFNKYYFSPRVSFQPYWAFSVSLFVFLSL